MEKIDVQITSIPSFVKTAGRGSQFEGGEVIKAQQRRNWGLGSSNQPPDLNLVWSTSGRRHRLSSSRAPS
ncbi:hypothetical protein ACOSQ3_014723 [Xanthoceras sorbifolium]